MDDKNRPRGSARRELGFARWYNEIERRFSLSDAGGARNEGGAASRGNALPRRQSFFKRRRRIARSFTGMVIRARM